MWSPSIDLHGTCGSQGGVCGRENAASHAAVWPQRLWGEVYAWAVRAGQRRPRFCAYRCACLVPRSGCLTPALACAHAQGDLGGTARHVLRWLPEDPAGRVVWRVPRRRACAAPGAGKEHSGWGRCSFRTGEAEANVCRAFSVAY